LSSLEVCLSPSAWRRGFFGLIYIHLHVIATDMLGVLGLTALEDEMWRRGTNTIRGAGAKAKAATIDQQQHSSFPGGKVGSQTWGKLCDAGFCWMKEI